MIRSLHRSLDPTARTGVSARTRFLRRYLVRTHNAPQPGATTMARLRPDPSFYASPKLATEAPPEELAYVALLATGGNGQRDALGVVDTNPASPTYGRLLGRTEFPHGGNELHHFGWNACSSHLCPYAPNAHVERRYLVVPGTHSSRIHILDTKPDPRRPELVRAISAETVMAATGYAAPHTVHCGPDGVYLNALGAVGGDG